MALLGNSQIASRGTYRRQTYAKNEQAAYIFARMIFDDVCGQGNFSVNRKIYGSVFMARYYDIMKFDKLLFFDLRNIVNPEGIGEIVFDTSEVSNISKLILIVNK